MSITMQQTSVDTEDYDRQNGTGLGKKVIHEIRRNSIQASIDANGANEFLSYLS